MKNRSEIHVVIGLSGGVDSSVAAYVLKEQGYKVTALFMQNWHDTVGVLQGDCPQNDDLIFAQLVARKLEIPFDVVDLSIDYKKRVVDYMFSEYEKGRTPNPDVLCNREIKFDLFLEAAKKLGADFVATGHYARKETIELGGKEVHRLLAGLDPNKDQSYFLCQLSQEQLSQSLFPIGDMLKPDLRMLAKKVELASADKKDSQGICFVGKVDLPVFLQQQLSAKQGNIIEISPDFETYSVIPDSLEELSKPQHYYALDGFVVGEHNGAHFYTIGQRKGLKVGGKAEPLFVIATDIPNNLIFVGQGQDHPGLFRKALRILPEEIHWVREDLAMQNGEEREYLVRIRYRQPLQKAKLIQKKEALYILFDEAQRGVTAGQFAAWYFEDELIGSGAIAE
ncbi:MAG: tRNA 2-thiouridine(34) synthase MnmA [Bacteroidales bacterium]|nr:tRNA 2-thiouridine(34) synthase MnmA [Bacteroidales bacterium]